ncbi:MAG: site-specific integrase [Fimbriimonadaceae bacterium]|nr:site-specific integrase [Fimbriimonadaceae bacterium]
MANQPGGARLPHHWGSRLAKGQQVEPSYDDKNEFSSWCQDQDPVYRIGRLNLRGIAPLAAAELKYGIYAHSLVREHTRWTVGTLQILANFLRRRRHLSLLDVLDVPPTTSEMAESTGARLNQICRETAAELRLIYCTKEDSKAEGFIETEHFGRRFPRSASTFDLTAVPQRWLRDLLWDHLAETLSSVNCPRTRGSFDSWRRSCVELGAFLELDAPRRGNDPAVLTAKHAERFVADQRHREKNGLPSLGVLGKDSEPSIVTTVTRRIVFNRIRQVLFRAMETGRTADIGLDMGFILAIPPGGADEKRARPPFSDDVARALADQDNLARFAADYDPYDRGLRDVWEIIVMTGRRVNEVLKLRLDCVGRYGGLAMLWHDQTKVGNYNEAIRIPEMIFARIKERQEKSIQRFENQHGRLPSAEERARIALFPSHIRNSLAETSVSYTFFARAFRLWIQELDLPPSVIHQARHTFATNLLRAGANLAQIRRYLGQVSDRMAEHYARVSNSDLEDVLQTVWVAGPGAPNPGQLLSGSEPLSREQAEALALDLSHRSTPAEGGFCTFQPVVNGGACPWQLNCEGCANFVLSGADLVYWKRKEQQWRSIAERAPDDVTAEYLHKVFQPTAKAIEGLERALATLGLLDQALTMDLRRPQDFFQRIWSLSFRANDLAGLSESADRVPSPEDLT